MRDTHLPASNHELETVEVGGLSTEGTALDLLSPRGLLPLTGQVLLLKSLGKSGAAEGAGNVDLKVGQGGTLEGDSLTLDTSGGTVNEHLFQPASVK